MDGMVKTTVELPDDLFIAAKKRAAELRRPLRDLIESGLRLRLQTPSSKQTGSRARTIRWVVVDGGLPVGVDISDRGQMRDWIHGKGR